MHLVTYLHPRLPTDSAEEPKKEVDHEAEVAELHRVIGKLKAENDFLSNLPALNLTGRRNKK